VGANLVISVRNWASAARRAAADWVLSGASASTLTDLRPDGFFLALMLAPWDRIFAAVDAPRPPSGVRGRPERIHRDILITSKSSRKKRYH
jgi:hypothetical protein